MQLFWADGSYRGGLVEWVKLTFGWTLQIVEKLEGQIGFQVLPGRWVVDGLLKERDIPYVRPPYTQKVSLRMDLKSHELPKCYN